MKTTSDRRQPLRTLPASPRDGQIALLRADAAGATDPVTSVAYVSNAAWEMMYLAAFGKWACIGGPPAFHYVGNQYGTSSTTLTDLTSVGPTITAPYAGLFIGRYGCLCYAGSGNHYAEMALVAGTRTTPRGDYTWMYGFNGTSAYHSPKTLEQFAVAADKREVRCRYATNTAATTAFFAERWMSLLPVYLTNAASPDLGDP